MEKKTDRAPFTPENLLWLALFFAAPAALAAACLTQQGEAGFEAWKRPAEFAVYLLWCGLAVRFFRLRTRRVESLGLGLLAAAAVSLGLTAAVFLFNNLLHFLECAGRAGELFPPPLPYGWFLREDLLYQGGAGPYRYVLAFTTTLMLCVLCLCGGELSGALRERLAKRAEEFFAELPDDDDDDDDGSGLRL